MTREERKRLLAYHHASVVVLIMFIIMHLIQHLIFVLLYYSLYSRTRLIRHRLIREFT